MSADASPRAAQSAGARSWSRAAPR
jgi:hypothetical protein